MGFALPAPESAAMVANVDRRSRLYERHELRAAGQTPIVRVLKQASGKLPLIVDGHDLLAR
jgi:hypothetical protein